MKSDAVERADALLAMAVDGLAPTGADFARVADGLEIGLNAADAAAGAAWEAELASDLATQSWSLAGMSASAKLGLAVGLFGVAVSASWWWASQLAKPMDREAKRTVSVPVEQAPLVIELTHVDPPDGSRRAGAGARRVETSASGSPSGAIGQVPFETSLAPPATRTHTTRIDGARVASERETEGPFAGQGRPALVAGSQPSSAGTPSAGSLPARQAKQDATPRVHEAVPDEPGPPDEARSSAAHLPAELRLIRQASRALDSGEAQRALKLLARHRRNYPDGNFRIERDGLSAVAGCATSAARDDAESFLQRHPTSPLAARVRQACGTDVPKGD